MPIDTEIKRISAVERFKDLDAGITHEIKQIVDLVAEICNTPVSLVTLLDENTQWFKAAKGTDVTQTPREMSFCNGTIRQTDVLIIPDLTADVQHQNNPLVTSDPNVRFYAGSPLITNDNYAIGSLCVVDMEPRNLNDQQINALKVLSKQVVNLMELNWSLKTLETQAKREQEQTIARRDSELKLKAIFDSSSDIHMLAGKNFEILAYNKSAAAFVKNAYKRKLTNGDCVLNITDNRILEQFRKYFKIALLGRSIKREWLLMRGTPHQCWHVTTFIPVKNHEGNIIGVSLNSIDITHQKRQEEHINIQNEALQRIAIIQSHELRRPVASLLGIMDLIKIENVPFNYFDMMEITVMELDEKIRDIVKDSENTLHTKRLSIVA